MKIIVLICMFCTTNIIFGQTPWTSKRYDSNQYEKKGEFRENRYGGVDYYERKNYSNYDNNYLQILIENRKNIINSNIRNARVVFNYFAESNRKGENAAYRKDFETARIEFYNAYLYSEKLISMPNVDTSDGVGRANSATAYANYLNSVLELGRTDEFIKMYNYNIIKYANGDISFLEKLYNNLIK